MTRRTVVAAILFGSAALATAQSSPAEWLRAFQNEISSDARRKMLAELPAGKSTNAVKLMLEALAEDAPARLDWWVRDGAIKALAQVRADDKKTLKLIEKIMSKPKPQTARLRATIVAALGSSKDVGHLDTVIEALNDPSAAVRRAAAFSLRTLRDAKGAAALFDRMKASWGADAKKPARGAEPDGFRELVSYTRALADLAPVDHGRDVEAWLRWWGDHGDGLKLREDFTEADRAELARRTREAAEQTRTRTVAKGVTVRHRSAGQGKIKLLVIHDSEWNGDYFEPWLEPLHDVCEITYVRLPEIADFDEKEVKIKRTPYGMAYMPVDALADAFDELRKEKGAERFALMAHGFSTLVAARYVSRHADKVSHLILINGLTGDGAYGNILDEMEKVANNVWKDKETTRMVMNHYIDDEKTGRMVYEPKDEAEAVALQRKAFDLYWADPADPYVGELYELCRTPVYVDIEQRFEHIVISPEFEISREQKPPIPVLAMVGEKTLWASVADNERLAKNYPRGRLIKFPNSGMFPFIEEAETFQAEVRKLLEQE